MSNDKTIPDGWPPGYRSLTYDGGWTWVLKVGTREIAGADEPGGEAGWYCSEEEARIAAHCHHRTTREWRLEQALQMLDLGQGQAPSRVPEISDFAYEIGRVQGQLERRVLELEQGYRDVLAVIRDDAEVSTFSQDQRALVRAASVRVKQEMEQLGIRESHDAN